MDSSAIFSTGGHCIYRGAVRCRSTRCPFHGRPSPRAPQVRRQAPSIVRYDMSVSGGYRISSGRSRWSNSTRARTTYPAWTEVYNQSPNIVFWSNLVCRNRGLGAYGGRSLSINTYHVSGVGASPRRSPWTQSPAVHKRAPNLCTSTRPSPSLCPRRRPPRSGAPGDPSGLAGGTISDPSCSCGSWRAGAGQASDSYASASRRESAAISVPRGS